MHLPHNPVPVRYLSGFPTDQDLKKLALSLSDGSCRLVMELSFPTVGGSRPGGEHGLGHSGLCLVGRDRAARTWKSAGEEWLLRFPDSKIPTLNARF
jgi:hypothetical protein